MALLQTVKKMMPRFRGRKPDDLPPETSLIFM